MGVRSTKLKLRPYCEGCRKIDPKVDYVESSDGDCTVEIGCRLAWLCRHLFEQATAYVVESQRTESNKTEARGPLDA